MTNYCRGVVPPLPSRPGGVCWKDAGHKDDCDPTERRQAVRHAPPPVSQAPALPLAALRQDAERTRRECALPPSSIVVLRQEDLERVQPFGADRVRITLISGQQIILDKHVIAKAAAVLVGVPHQDPKPYRPRPV